MRKITTFYGIWGHLKFRQSQVTAGIHVGISMNNVLNNTESMVDIRACNLGLTAHCSTPLSFPILVVVVSFSSKPLRGGAPEVAHQANYAKG